MPYASGCGFRRRNPLAICRTVRAVHDEAYFVPAFGRLADMVSICREQVGCSTGASDDQAALRTDGSDRAIVISPSRATRLAAARISAEPGFRGAGLLGTVLIRQPPIAKADCDRVRSIIRTQLQVNGPQHILHRLAAGAEVGGDVAVLVAIREQFDDLELFGR